MKKNTLHHFPWTINPQIIRFPSEYSAERMHGLLAQDHRVNTCNSTTIIDLPQIFFQDNI